MKLKVKIGDVVDDPLIIVVLQAKARKNRTSHRVQKAQKVRNVAQL